MSVVWYGSHRTALSDGSLTDIRSGLPPDILDADVIFLPSYINLLGDQTSSGQRCMRPLPRTWNISRR